MSHYPEDDGLVRVAGEDLGAQWEWDVTDVWRDPMTDEFYIYEGSGCSCNGPYEYYDGRGDLGGPYTVHEVLSRVSTELKERVLRATV